MEPPSLRDGYYRDPDGKLTKYKNGDRFFYVNEDALKKPLPRNGVCGPFSFRIYHEGQNFGNPRDSCQVCKQPGHKAGDPKCEHYCENQKNVTMFGGAKDALSNFHMCNVVYQDERYKSTEHAYQVEKAKQCGRPDLVDEIQTAKNPFQAKQTARQIGADSQWEKQEKNIKTMKDILHAKCVSVPSVKNELMQTGDNILAEAVPFSNFWGTGLDKNATSKTKQNAWPGENKMGKLLMELRNEFRTQEKEKALKSQLETESMSRKTKKSKKTPKKERKPKRNRASDGSTGRRTKQKMGSTEDGGSQPKMTEFIQKNIHEARVQTEGESEQQESSDEVFDSDEETYTSSGEETAQ